MPGGDRTGPFGLGPRTGRGLGYCSGYNSPGYTKGRGRAGFGRGFRGGWCWWRTPVFESVPLTLTKEEEIKILEAELKEIEREKEEIEKKLKELKETKKSK